MPDRKKLFLVDGMSNIYRAYYAIRGLSNSKGMATNAVFGFAMMLRKLISAHNPDYLGVVLDSKEKTFRHEAYEKYKSNRPDMPEDLVAQLPYIERVCEALRVPVLRLPRYEADDILGTLARQASSEGVQTVIVSSDKDLCQLVRDPDVIILKIDRAGEIWIDEAGVRARLGVRADQVVDLLGLMGDPTDMIPGAPGIGEKGAVQLLEQFDAIEGALAGWESVKKKTYRESLRDNAEIIRTSRELARIDLNVPVSLDLDALKYEQPDARLAYELFSELEFSQLTREFASGAPSDSNARPSEATEGEYHIVASLEDIKKLADSLLARDRFAFAFADAANSVADSSDDPPDEESVSGVALSGAPRRADFVDLAACGDRDSAVHMLGELFDNGLLESSVHDLKRAIPTAERLRIALNNVADDTLLAAYLLDPERNRYETGDLAREYLQQSVVEPESAPARALLAADLTNRLADVLASRLEAEGLTKVYREIELPLAPLLYRMERAGFRVDTNVLAELSGEMERELESLTVRIYELAGEEFNINSPSQLGEVFERLNFDVSRRTSTGKISTSRDILDELALKYELPRLVIEFRELMKLKGTYVDAFPKLVDPRDGRIHTTLNQAATATGRLSSTEPNLQNIPIRTPMGRRIRRAFIPADGYVLLSADYSQIELRLLAHITQDAEMLDAFRKGEDIHARTARSVFGAQTEEELKEKRRVAKIVNFGIAYAIGAFGLAQRINIPRGEARKVIEDYYRTYAGVRKYMEELPDRARDSGCIVRSIFGRLRRLPDLEHKNGNLRARAEREAINMPMQGSASDIVKIAMLKADAALGRAGLSARMILQVHDELIFEVPEAELAQASEVIRTAMESAAQLAVPLVVEIGAGKNWMDAKP
ncbi:MAG: DNA polymerase I [Blastocatellales bacterium]|nr:DNA polymerase I [Blastocatellales bacterium]